MPGIHLVRTDENAAEIDALAAQAGGRVGIEGVLADLDRRARRTWAPGRAVRRTLTWDAGDRRDPMWWPQGISTSADASVPDDRVAGRRVIAVAWYSKADHGSRVSFLDVDTRRYRHVLLVVPVLRDGVPGLEPLTVHAGGIVWRGPYLHVAATARGFYSCRLDDLLRVRSLDHDYVLPVRFAYRAVTPPGAERVRYSFLSLDRESTPQSLVVGEYGRASQTRRLMSYPLDPTTWLLATDEQGRAVPTVHEDGVAGMQGAVVARGRWHVTVSHGTRTPGSVYVGQPGRLVRSRWATPIGPEDLTWWPSTDRLWSVTEHPGRRWIYSMRRSWFDQSAGAAAGGPALTEVNRA